MKGSIQIVPGVSVSFKGRRFRITHVLDLETVLATEEATGDLERLLIKYLAPADDPRNESDETGEAGNITELTSVDKEDWEEANRRYSIIKPLLGCVDITI